eukprot:9380245-Pyramimonas_sp.AAC.1
MSTCWSKSSLRDLRGVRGVIADIGIGETLGAIDHPRLNSRLRHDPSRPAAPEPIQDGDGVRVTIVVCGFVGGDFHRGLERRSPSSSSSALALTSSEPTMRLVEEKGSARNNIEVAMKNKHVAQRIIMCHLQ